MQVSWRVFNAFYHRAPLGISWEELYARMVNAGLNGHERNLVHDRWVRRKLCQRRRKN